MNKIVKQKRVVVYLPEKDYKILRAALIMEGKTVSGWFREKVKELLNKKKVSK